MARERPMVIGIGNEHRGDDIAGLLAVRALSVLIEGGASADIVEHRGDGASLIERWTGRNWVILVDAVQAVGAPGRVLHLDASKQPLDVAREHGSTHVFGATGAIEMARCLGRLPPRVELYGVTGNVFSIGAEAQPSVVDAARAAARSIAERIVPVADLLHSP